MESIQGNIVDVNIKENGTIYAKVEIGGKVIGKTGSTAMKQEGIDNLPSVNPLDVRLKLIKANQDAASSVKAAEKYSALIGDSSTRIVSTERFGNFIVGPTTFISHPEEIRIGGSYRLNGLMTSTMASTIITPIPTLVFDYPLEDTLKIMAALTKEFTDFITGIIA